MAKEEHLEILRRGVEEWNDWRIERLDPDGYPLEVDLIGANLKRVNLKGANLFNAKLDGADLTGANLRNADLGSVELRGAILIDADLSNTKSSPNRASYISHTKSARSDFNDRSRTIGRGTFVLASLDPASYISADFSGADFTHARLRNVNLNSAILRDADLRDADLLGTNLINADLSNAKLTGADLSCADLSRADLARADFAYAHLAYTSFANVDLSQVQGLDVADHGGPSDFNIRTLERSRGQISRAFLKGCGFSDWEIEAARLFNPDLTEDERTLIHYEIMRIQGEQPIMQTRLFISYSHGDTDFVEALEPLLDAKGVRYWRDVHDLRAGRMETQIDRGIALNPLVLLILSDNSVESDWVEHEAATARELEKAYRKQGQPRDVLCPISLDGAWRDSAWPRALRRQIEDYMILDFSGWKDQAEMDKQFQRLYEGILLNYPAAP